MSEITRFNNARLSQARIARGLTKTQLAELTGITKQSISNYENGKQVPRPDYIDVLAERLGVTLSFFQKDSIFYSDKSIFFRSHRGLAQREWSRAEIKLQWFEELFLYFTEFIDFVPQNIPDSFDVSNHIGKVTQEEIEEIAIACRKYWGLGLGPISNMVRLLENNGVLIIKMPLDVKEEDAFSQWQNDNKTPVVVMVADQPSACRDRFSIAHELGHLILHKNLKITDANLSLIEEQANMFASAFLLPAASYLREFRYPTLEILKILKERWKVSIKAQIFRCKELRLINENSARNFYVNIAKRKWTKIEPLDNEIPAEEPKVIRETLKILDQNAGINFDDISASTGLSAQDIISLCGIEPPQKEEIQRFPTVRANRARIIPFNKQS